MAKAAKGSLLDHFYEHLEERDWLEGVDLYQGQRVLDLKTFEGLVTARVDSGHARAEVRMKVLPAAQSIQWIECTCRKNRAQAQYCEHIAAFMIHLDRERPDLLATSGNAAPLKPPFAPKKPRATPNPLAALQQLASPGETTAKRQAGANQTILDHLKGSIQGISLIAHGPQLRVRIEIKPSHITTYDLGIDDAAKFLAKHLTSAPVSDEVGALRVFDECVEVGIRLRQIEPERLVAERVVTLRLGRKPSSFELKLAHELTRCRRLTVDGADPKDDAWLIVPSKSAARYLGDRHFFLPGHGYYQVAESIARTAWAEFPLTKTYRDDDAAELVRSGFAELLANGPIYLDDELLEGAVAEAPHLEQIVLVEQAEHGGWFRLDPRYGHGKGGISMVELIKQWTTKKRRYVKSGAGWLKIPEFVTQHQWELDDQGEAVKVDALGLLRLKAAVGDFDQFVGSRRMIDKLRDRLEFTPELTEPVPHGTDISLRHYQDTGLRWLWWLYKNGLHGLLADEMGLGKTHQAMALLAAILHVKPDAKFLVICPTTVLDHWLDKVEQYVPSLKPVKYHGPRRGNALAEIERRGFATLVTSYGVMLRDLRTLTAREWEVVVLDEAHMVKNNDTATYQAACRLRSHLRLCLTGTPMENNLGELKNLFDFLVPGYLGSDEYFRRNFVSPLQTEGDPKSTLALQKLIHPFKMRRTKEQVLSDLPAKVEDLRHCGLSDEQVRLYQEVLSLKARPLIEKLRDDATPIPYLHVFATLTMLKQICDHPALLTDQPNYKKHESGKFELLRELLDEALGSGHKIVIFSQYVGMITLITKYLTDMGIGHVTLTGQTRNRGEVIKAFQTDPNLKIFCGSLLAGGIGIDLTAASVVVHYDRWWNATKESQATDRVHRIGQNKNVQVLKLITRGTLEEKIHRLIESKRALFEKFLDKDEEVFKTLSRQELLSLLE